MRDTARYDGPAMGLRHDQGIVLRGFPFGEADRVVVLLSPNHGKLRTVAKGVRKTTSRFGGRLEPFSHVDLVLYEGRNLDTITQVEVIEAFPRLRAELDRVMAAGAMVEVVDGVAQPGESSLRLFLLLLKGLRTLEGAPLHADLVTSFLLKLIGVIGLAPSLDRCAACGSLEGLGRFSLAGGGVLCERCPGSGGARLRDGLVEYLTRLSAAELEALPEADPLLSRDAMGVTRRFVEYHLDRRLGSLALSGSQGVPEGGRAASTHG